MDILVDRNLILDENGFGAHKDENGIKSIEILETFLYLLHKPLWFSPVAAKGTARERLKPASVKETGFFVFARDRGQQGA